MKTHKKEAYLKAVLSFIIVLSSDAVALQVTAEVPVNA